MYKCANNMPLGTLFRNAFRISFILILWCSFGQMCGPGAGVNHHYTNGNLNVADRQPDFPETNAVASGEYTGPISPNDKSLEPIITTEIVFASHDLKSNARKAIKPCREALINLADQVKVLWNRKYKLKVTHGYASNQEANGRHLLHLEGRAFDFTLVPAPTKGGYVKKSTPISLHNLQRLAGIAYYKADFSYVEVHPTHVHASCRKEETSESDSSRCFPANSYVRNEFGEKVLMKNVKVGSKVLTLGNNGETTVSEVIMIMHKKENEWVNDYVAIETESGRKITLSSHHLIYTKEKKFIFAKDVLINQTIVSTSFSLTSSKEEKVSGVNFVREFGAYAPLTLDGTMVVNDIFVSCYALFPSHDISHAVFSVWRFIYRLGGYYLHPGVESYHWYPNIFRTSLNFLQIFPYKF